MSSPVRRRRVGIERSVWIRFLANLRETITLAIDSLRASKLRSGLTVLGVVIGVAVVMAMASIVQGIRDQIVSTIEIAGPTTFYVMKVWSQTPINPEDLPKWVRVRPDLSTVDAERIAAEHAEIALDYLPALFDGDLARLLGAVARPPDGIVRQVLEASRYAPAQAPAELIERKRP